MRFVSTILAAGWIFCASPLFASDQPAAAVLASPISTATLELLLENAMSRNLISGGVVLVGNHEGILATASRGRVNSGADAPALSERTIFDIASLTKVVATAPAVMKLVDDGLVALSDPLSRWFPEVGSSHVKDLTVLNLLTHTSGLVDLSMRKGQTMPALLERVAAQKYRPAGRFKYADINFILLGELVQRASGEPLDAFCRQKIYGPLKARDTLFLPPRELVAKIAPTLGFASGVVQDYNARRLGGVAGHAGLFSSAYDLARFARLILGAGILGEKRILSEQAVAQMTTPYACGGDSVLRGLGWDIHSPYSAPRGSYFSPVSFGHTGYSGSSIWIDPQQDLFVIFLTNRTNYKNVRAFNQLRRDVSTVAVGSARLNGTDGDMPLEMARITTELMRQKTREVLQVASVEEPSSFTAKSTKKCRQIAKGGVKKKKTVAKANQRSLRGKAANVKNLATRKKKPRARPRG